MLKRVPQIKHYLQCLPLAVLTLFIKFSCSLSLQIPPTYNISTFSLKYESILTHNVSSVNIYLMDIHGKRKLFPSQVALIRHYDSIPVFSPLRIFPKYSIS